jgi:hypothetical protein
MKMRRLLTIFSVLLLFSLSLHSQVTINTDGSPGDTSAILDVNSSTKGLLIPRLTYEQRNSIMDPAEGLIIFCINCGENNIGVLSVFTNGNWYNINLCKIDTPDSCCSSNYPASIVWRWRSVPEALGYKWGTTNVLANAVDVGNDTLWAETGIQCNTLYTRYIWAYSECGYSMPLVLTQTDTICWECGEAVEIDHVAGNLAPVNKSTSYNTVSNIPGETTKCWITKNLGADQQPSTVTDNTEASAGWYWQFNRLQGYKHDGTTRTPNSQWITTINEYSVWTSSNDPCTQTLGPPWRIPTITEWENVDAAGNWSNYSGPFNSNLKMHAAGRIDNSTGLLVDRGSRGYYWSSTQTGSTDLGQDLFFNSSNCLTNLYSKSFGFSIRCIME